MLDPTRLGGDVVINGIKYALARDVSSDWKGIAWQREKPSPDQEGEVGEIVTAVWDQGWQGGMGEMRRIGPDSDGYAFSQNWCCDQPGFARLSPSVNQLTVTGLSTGSPVFFFEDATSGGLWILNGATLVKIGKSTPNVIYTRTVSAALGVPALFEGKWYVPQTGVQFEELTTIAYETWTKVWAYISAAYTDRTTEANSAAGTPFTMVTATGDILYVGSAGKFGGARVDIATAGVGGTVVWEYWNGAWTALSETDGTSEFTVDGNVTWAVPADWATTAVNGTTTYWARARCTGNYSTSPTANYIGPIDEWTLSDAGLFADHFAITQDGATAKINRAYSTNLVAKAATAPKTAGSWGSGFEAGDTSYPITSIADTGTSFFVAKQDNLYLMDSTGSSYPVFNVLRGSAAAQNGTGLVTIPGMDIGVYNHVTGLYCYEGGSIGAIGPDTQTAMTAVSTLDVPFRGQHWGSVFIGRYLYSIYAGDGSYLLSGYRRGATFLNNVVWHSLIYSTHTLRGLYIDSDQTAWSVTNNDTLDYISLSLTGAPDETYAEDIAYGVASTTAILYLPEVPFYRDNGEPVPTVLKQLRSIEVLTRNVDETCPLQLQVMRDGAAAANVGTAISTAGMSTKYWTAGSSDTAYLVRPVLSITTTSGYDAATDPQVHKLIMRAALRPDLAETFHCIIDTSRAYDNGARSNLPASVQRTNLQSLESAASVTVTDPPGTARSMNIVSVRDMKTWQDDLGQLQYLLEVTLRERVTS